MRVLDCGRFFFFLMRAMFIYFYNSIFILLVFLFIYPSKFFFFSLSAFCEWCECVCAAFRDYSGLFLGTY